MPRSPRGKSGSGFKTRKPKKKGTGGSRTQEPGYSSKIDPTTVRLGVGRHFYSGGGRAFRPAGGSGKRFTRTSRSGIDHILPTDPVLELDRLHVEALRQGARVTDLADLYRTTGPLRALEAEKARLIVREHVNPEVAGSIARKNLAGFGIKVPGASTEPPRHQPAPQKKSKSKPGARRK
ncbi:MAG: hypothetical protein V1493_04420 [Candidatus Diapherotrites archaeon]